MKDKETEQRELAAAIARGIFKIGDDPNSPCQRIQFMGGQWPGNERPQGGLTESALSREIYGIIRESALLREAGRVK